MADLKFGEIWHDKHDNEIVMVVTPEWVFVIVEHDNFPAVEDKMWSIPDREPNWHKGENWERVG